MTKVYVVMRYWYEDSYPVGVHKSKAKAEEHKKKHRLYEIEEFDLIE